MLPKASRGANCLTKQGKAAVSNFGSKSRDTYLLVLYVTVAIIFFFVISLNQRSYQDVWILDGITIPTVAFVLFSLVSEALIDDNRKVVIAASLFLFAMNLIPGLKYPIFSGCYDSPGHFAFTQEMVFSGSVPKTEFYSEVYAGNCGMHILMSCVSLISGISVNEVFKFVFPGVLSTVPLIVYFFTKGSLSSSVQKSVIIISSFPILTMYVVYGTNLGMIPYLLLIAIFLRQTITTKFRREFFALFLVVGFGLIISHAVTALFAAVILVGTSAALKFLEITRMKSFLSRFPASSSILLSMSYFALLVVWWSQASIYNLEAFGGYLKNIIYHSVVQSIPARFYEIPLLAQLQVISVLHLGDFVIGVLSLFGLLILVRELTRSKLSHNFQAIYLHLLIFVGVALSFLSVYFISSPGTVRYTRFLKYTIPLCIPLAGLTISQIKRFLRGHSPKTIQNIAFVAVLFALVLACLIQFFPLQPLIPRANVLSEDLPEDEFIVDFGVVNTPCQKAMINFAERYSSGGRVAADTVTRCQTYGFSSSFFFSRVWWQSPLSQNLTWDLLMLHTRKAAHFYEKVEYRTSQKIQGHRFQGNTIYDNEGSFIVSHLP